MIPMKCSEFPWIDFLENRLGTASREAAEAHLVACPACSAQRARWGRLLAEAGQVVTAHRLGCPTPDDLLDAESRTGKPGVREHLEECALCRRELEAVRGAEDGVEPSREELPAALAARLAGPGPETMRGLAAEVLDLVRSRLGSSHGSVDKWRRAVAHVVAETNSPPLLAAGAAYAAPGEGVERAAPEPTEVRICSRDLDLDLTLQGPWVRARATRSGAPLAGLTIRVENELGEITETETDLRGQATLRDDLPGRRRIRVGAPHTTEM
jgi:hypothetical protein